MGELSLVHISELPYLASQHRRTPLLRCWLNKEENGRRSPARLGVRTIGYTS